MLQTWAGRCRWPRGWASALQALRRGLEADEAALLAQPPDGPRCRAAVSRRRGVEPARGAAPAARRRCGDAAGVRRRRASRHDRRGGALRRRCRSRRAGAPAGRTACSVAFPAPGGRPRWSPGGAARRHRTPPRCWRTPRTRCGWRWNGKRPGRARQETMALRRSQELQRGFLSRLSHELRTPLTAIQGYASSLLQPDVTLGRGVAAALPDPDRGRVGPARPPGRRPARLLRHRVRHLAVAARLVRHPAGARCRHRLPAGRPATAAGAQLVEVDCPTGCRRSGPTTTGWSRSSSTCSSNAIRHNPPGTRVRIRAAPDRAGHGAGHGGRRRTGAAARRRRRRRSSRCGGGAGRPVPAPASGLSIARGIVAAHGGRMELDQPARGTCFRIHLPVGGPRPPRTSAVVADA